jgi:hypothetical protein
MDGEGMTHLELKIKLLQLEIEALRSVLSEFDKDELLSFTQWHAAEAISRVLEVIK